MTLHKWILLVEDDGNDADLIQRMLADSASPIEVVRVKDGAEALDCLYRRDRFIAYDHGPPSLMLLDLNLPRVGGFEVLAQIKTDPGLKTVPVMVFTSSSDPADMVRCYQLGANAYVVKPAGLKQLFETVQEILRFWINFNESSPAIASKTAAAKIAA